MRLKCKISSFLVSEELQWEASHAVQMLYLKYGGETELDTCVLTDLPKNKALEM